MQGVLALPSLQTRSAMTMWSNWLDLTHDRLGLECALPDDLRTLTFFEDLSAREEAVLRKALIGRRFKDGELVFHEGEPGLGMYVVAQGSVEIFRSAKAFVIATLGPGEIFGEIALLNQVTRMAAARAQGETELLLMHQPAFHRLVEKHPRLGVRLLLALARVMGIRQIRMGDTLDELVNNKMPHKE